MVLMHKHSGIYTSSGSLRSHPVSRTHKDRIATNAHNREVAKRTNRTNNKQTRPKLSGSHKHKGYENYKGVMKSHPKSQQHKDTRVQKWHDKALAVEPVKFAGKKPTTKNPITKKQTKQKLIGVEVDTEGYLSLNLDSLKSVKGLKVEFTRREGDTKKNVKVKIKNNPAILKRGERIKKIHMEKIYKPSVKNK